MKFIPRFFKGPKTSFFLFGPRGTGKSTWLKATYPGALTVDLLDADVFRTLNAKPERLKEIGMAAQNQQVVVIDEVQKLPVLLDIVHSLMEQHKKIQFILTGSSARKLKREGVDLLAGRAVMQTLHPFMASELKSAFSLEGALAQGLLPVVIESKDPAKTLKTYLSLYIREEVQMEGIVRNLGNFSRFLEAVSLSHGQVLNINNVGRDCEVKRNVVESYISVLEDLLISYRLFVFQKKIKRKLSVHPKFYFFDTGVFQSLRPQGPLDIPSEIGGAGLEGLVAQHLKAWISYSENDCQLYFWRSQSGNEVDFVLYGPENFFAIEVKNATKLHPQDFNGLEAFKTDYPQCKAILLYRGKFPYKHKGILCLPCENFLVNLIPSQKLALSE